MLLTFSPQKIIPTSLFITVRDIAKAALTQAVDQDVLETNVARKTGIREIEESDSS